MVDTKDTTEKKEETKVEKTEVSTDSKTADKKPVHKGKRTVSFVGKDKPGRGGKRRGPREGRRAGEPDQKVLDIRRVTRVVAGGRRFSFSVTMVVGDRKGRVGVGVGKGADTAVAMDKATRDGKKNMIKVPMTKERSIEHETKAKYCSAVVYIKPAKGKGLVAGSAVRSVLDLAGVTDVNAKILSRSKNKLNIARATVKALAQLI